MGRFTIINSGFLRHLGGSAQREVRRALLKQLIPNDADTVLGTAAQVAQDL